MELMEWRKKNERKKDKYIVFREKKQRLATMYSKRY